MNTIVSHDAMLTDLVTALDEVIESAERLRDAILSGDLDAAEGAALGLRADSHEVAGRAVWIADTLSALRPGYSYASCAGCGGGYVVPTEVARLMRDEGHVCGICREAEFAGEEVP